MNKRKAGEDFYFLEKLIKTSKVVQIKDVLVYPSSRVSSRVSFGTGARIQRFLNNTHDEFQLYSPQCFIILQKWIELLSNEKYLRKPEILLTKAKEINIHLWKFLVGQAFEKNWTNIINNSKSFGQLNRQKNNWMDGFRTLKLVHYLRDNVFPNKNMFDAINGLLDVMNINFSDKTTTKIPTIEIQEEYLKLLRELT